MAVILIILGLSAISFGVGMISLPAGIIAAGASLTALGLLWIKGRSAALFPPDVGKTK